jgi:hypothetical protein
VAQYQEAVLMLEQSPDVPAFLKRLGGEAAAREPQRGEHSNVAQKQKKSRVLKVVATIAACVAVYVVFLYGVSWLGRISGRGTQTHSDAERCAAEIARADFERCMSGKLDVDLALSGWANRREYCLSKVGISREMARLYPEACPQQRNSK